MLRWSSVVVLALENGAERIEAFAEPEQALKRKAELGGHALAVGERNAAKLPGFDLGNAIAEYSREAVQGKVLCSTTTNGTRALLAAQGAQHVLIGSFLNFGATAGALAALGSRGMPLTLVAAGQDGGEALEDTGCAGAFVDWFIDGSLVTERDLEPGARRAREVWIEHHRRVAEVFAAAPHAQALARAGYAPDLTDASRLNTSAIVAVAQGNVVRRATSLTAG